MRSWTVPSILLLVYAIAFGVAAFGGASPGFDDHPGQRYRLGHALTEGAAPWTWNVGWWAGYPELQFYPPGFFYAGVALSWLSARSLSVAAIYQALLWLTWIAPGVTAYALLARLTGGWAALPGALVALTLSAGTASGVEGAVHVGMLPARLALSLLPLLALIVPSSGPWTRRAWLAVPCLAAIALTHPTHVPGAMTLLVVAVIVSSCRRDALASVAAVAVIAAAWTGFWSVPLLGHLQHTRALAWGRLSLEDALTPLGVALVALAALASLLARSPRERVIAIWPWAMAAVVALDSLVAEPLGIRWLPSDRVADAAWLAVVLAAGCATARLLERLAARTRVPLAALSLAAVAIGGVASLPGHVLLLWPRRIDWPSEATVERGLRLDALWSTLARGSSARVLFTRSGVPLVYGTEWWRPHSHATALTPVAAGRAIVHGTFTHPSPVAALVYRGDVERGAIDLLAEQVDGRTLFGRPVETLDPATFNRLTERLGIGTVVVLDEDLPRLRALRENPEFTPRETVGPFTIYERGAVPRVPVRLPDGRWRLEADGAAGEWVPARVTFYPLWTAERGGAPLQTRRGPLWDLEVKLDAGAGPIDLRYAPGAWEFAGIATSLGGFAAWIILVLRARRSHRVRAPTREA